MGAPDAKKLTTTPRSGVEAARHKGEYPRSGSAATSRVSVRHVKGFRLGLSRSVAPIFPAGHAIAWTVSLGKLELVWGRVR